MLRVVVTVVLPLVLPSALYLTWAMAARRVPATPDAWRALPWPYLAGVGVVLAVGVLALVHIGFGTPNAGRYIPAHMEGGELVPGHFEPDAASR